MATMTLISTVCSPALSPVKFRVARTAPSLAVNDSQTECGARSDTSVVGGISLEKIYMMATPLHSQNYIDEKEGLITNNRRIMTKNMWFNGTSLSEKARRALENEQVTIVSHISGYIHTVYAKATISRDHYLAFADKLKAFVKTPLTPAVFINFLRFKPVYKCLFQYRYNRSGHEYFIPLEKLYEYEHSSKFSVNEETRDKLLAEVDSEEFFPDPAEGKLFLNDVEKFLRLNGSLETEEIKKLFISTFNPGNDECVEKMFTDIREFTVTEPRLPSAEKIFVSEAVPEIRTDDSRAEIIRKVKEMAGVSEMALLALYAYRDPFMTDWRPFVKAAIERNPVCHSELAKLTPDEIYVRINELNNKSIYDDGRIAQPDEVWNFRRGDGAEKVFLMADALHRIDSDAVIDIELAGEAVRLWYNGNDYSFVSVKGLKAGIHISGNSYSAS